MRVLTVNVSSASCGTREIGYGHRPSSLTIQFHSKIPSFANVPIYFRGSPRSGDAVDGGEWKRCPHASHARQRWHQSYTRALERRQCAHLNVHNCTTFI